MHDTDAVSDFAERFVRCIRMLRELTLVNHYYMPYTKLMRERIPHLSSASPLRAFPAHPPHTGRPHIMGAQYTHRTVRTKDASSSVRFLFFYPKECTIKIAGWKTFFMEKTHADFFHCKIRKPRIERFRIYLPAFIRRVLRAAP